MSATIHESVSSLLAELKIDTSHSSISLDALAAADSRYLKELKLNLVAVLGGANVPRKNALMIALSVAVNEKNNTLSQAFEKLLVDAGATAAEIGEVHACVSLMNVNNVVYRFRHFIGNNEYYNNHPLGLRMGLMLNPILGKPLFELLSLVISAVNGCERCVISHEHSVRELGVAEAVVYDAVRIGGVVKGLAAIL